MRKIIRNVSSNPGEWRLVKIFDKLLGRASFTKFN